MSPSLFITFARKAGPPLDKGPYAEIRLEGEVMRCDGAVLATHRGREWRVGGEQFTRVQCDAVVVIHFERLDGRATGPAGPFSGFSFQDGVAFVEHRLFAVADRSIGDWYCHEQGQHWQIMVIRPA